MSKRAEERAREEICTRCPERLKHCGLMDYPNQCINAGHFVFGYEQAEKDTIERAVEWLKFNLQDYAGFDDKKNQVPFDKDIFNAFMEAMEKEETK